MLDRLVVTGHHRNAGVEHNGLGGFDLAVQGLGDFGDAIIDVGFGQGHLVFAEHDAATYGNEERITTKMVEVALEHVVDLGAAKLRLQDQCGALE